MSIIRTIIFLFYNLINLVNFKLNHLQIKNFNLFGIPFIYNKGNIITGKNIKINSSKFKNIIGGDTRTSIVVKKNAELIIGDNLKMSNSAIYCAEKITIGNNVMIGGSCKIWDTDFHPLNPTQRENSPNLNYLTKPIEIGNNVFIGGFSIILKGVKIGDNSIVGAGSVVCKDIPENQIWGGNPAKFIKQLSINNDL